MYCKIPSTKSVSKLKLQAQIPNINLFSIQVVSYSEFEIWNLKIHTNYGNSKSKHHNRRQENRPVPRICPTEMRLAPSI